MAAKRLLAVDFEVFGLVQGVFFRKYAVNAAKANNLVGWVRNTEDDTVAGHMQGEESDIAKMKHWLQSEGSPHSRIDKAVFQNERPIDQLEFKSFDVKH